MDWQKIKAKFSHAWSFVKKTAKRVWEYLKVAKMEYIIMISLFAVDLISKWLVNAFTSTGDTITLIPYFLNITNLHNYDAAFGADWLKRIVGGEMGARILYCIFAFIASAVFIIMLVRAKGGNKLFRVALALVTAGAMGNCIDRMFLGYVRDFIEFVYFGLTIFGSKTFYVFNIADACLVIGVILIVVYFIFIYKEKPKSDVVRADADQTQDANAAPVSETADQAEGEKLEANGITDGQTEKPNEAEKSATEAGEQSEKPKVEAEKSATEADGQTEKPIEAEKSATEADVQTEEQARTKSDVTPQGDGIDDTVAENPVEQSEETPQTEKQANKEKGKRRVKAK